MGILDYIFYFIFLFFETRSKKEQVDKLGFFNPQIVDARFFSLILNINLSTSSLSNFIKREKILMQSISFNIII